jgi:S-adenosylmethionine hydrolase
MITLLSDFGESDVYVGVMKGVIARIDRSIPIVDLTHQILPQDIAAARFSLMNAYPYFPPETVHIAVVDPGVGSSRRGVAIELAGGYLVGPDNGLFSGVLSQYPAIAAVELTNSNYWRTPQPSNTFHGRDIFAPVGAHLAGGVNLSELGEAIAPSSLVRFPIAEYSLTNTGVAGCIQYVDRFGNLITNIPAGLVEGKNWSVMAGNIDIPSGYTYSDRPLGSPLALIGSHGWVEIAVNGGNAKSQLNLDCLDVVQVILRL